MIRPALIGLAHGSRDPRSAAAIQALMAAAGELLPGVLAAAAFLDLNPPDLVATLREVGCDRAVVVPLLFSQAYHAGHDVPDTVREATAATGVALTVTPILGTGEPVLSALAQRAQESGAADADDLLLVAVGSSDAGANASVRELAERWASRRGRPVHAAFATCAPRAVDTLRELRVPGRTVGIAPLFLAPGLLLDLVLRDPVAAGCPAADVLGAALAALVAERYLTAAGSPADPPG